MKRRTPKPTPPASKGDIRKREIIESAIECVALEGVSRTTFESIGRRIQIGKSHVLYHFPKLEDLFLVAAQYVYRTGQEIVEEFMSAETDPVRQLPAYIQGTFYWLKTHPEHAGMGSFMLYESIFDPRYRAIQKQVKEVGQERIARMLARQPRLKSLSPARVRQLADLIQCQLLGSISYAFSTGKVSQLGEREKQTLDAVEGLLRSAVTRRSK